MADSDDEYDRKRRDKFRGERSSGDSYRSDRRDDRRAGGGGGGGGRDDWSDRNPFRGGGGGRARPDYRDYRPPRDRYGSPGREMPPAKRMRPDWGDELRGGPRYSAYDPYLMHAWNEHYASTHGLHGGYGHGPIIAHPREQNVGSDVQTQPAMLTLKQFLDTQDDGISDSEVLRKYTEYKLEFKRQQLNEFFVAHKDEEWFKNKYHPVECVRRSQEQQGFLKKRVDVFSELLANGSIKSVSVDTNQQDPLLRLLDTVVIKLEGGTDDDLKILDEKPRDLIFPDRVIEKKIEVDDDVIITSVEKKKTVEDEPQIVSPRPIRRAHAATDDEENWDEDDDDPPPSKKKDDEDDDDEEDDKFKDEDENHRPEKKVERKRKASNSDSSSSSSSSDSDTTSSSSSDEDDDGDKSNDKYDLGKVKQEKDDIFVEKKTIADEGEKMLVEESLKQDNSTETKKPEENGLDEKDDVGSDDNASEKGANDEKNRAEKVDATEEEEERAEKEKETTEAEEGVVELNTSAVSEEKEDDKLTTETKEDDGEKIITTPSKDQNEDVAQTETETIDLDIEKEKPRPRALHRTSSIFLRNLAPSITKAEIETICQRFDGYLRVAIADPLVERRWYRRGWVTFKRDVNIKEYCWNLNNTRLRDCEMGAIVNRDLSRRVRPVNGMTAHKTILRADIKLCARIALNLDAKFKLWEKANEGAESSKDNQELCNTSNSYGFNSNNPVLQNITDYLIEEASAEEDELLGLTGGDNKDAEGGEALDRDPQLISVLDSLILYLRIVHSVDFYNHCEYPYEDEMPNRCGIIHARGPPPQKVTQNDMQEYIKSFETKMQTFLAKTTTIDDEELKNLGSKDADAEVEKFVQANTQELAKDKWLCPLSGKKFKGPEFIRKHIFNKHMDKVDEVRKEVEFFNSYLRDPKRPQLPEHPGNTKRNNSESTGGYRPPAYAPMYPPYAAYAPPMLMPSRGGRGYGGRRPGGEYRQLIQYRDLDAPQDPVDMFT